MAAEYISQTPEVIKVGDKINFSVKQSNVLKNTKEIKMNLKYPQEVFEDSIYKEFQKDCPETQLEPNTIHDFIKWAIIKGYLKDRPKDLIREMPGLEASKYYR